MYLKDVPKATRICRLLKITFSWDPIQLADNENGHSSFLAYCRIIFLCTVNVKMYC